MLGATTVLDSMTMAIFADWCGQYVETSRTIRKEGLINAPGGVVAKHPLTSVRSADTREQAERAEAAEWLAALLPRGPMGVTDIRKAAEADCISWRTMERAKKSLGVQSCREGFGNSGRFTWKLPQASS